MSFGEGKLNMCRKVGRIFTRIIDNFESCKAIAGMSQEDPKRDTVTVNRLPVELLSKIFLICVGLNRISPPSTECAPLLLGRICSHWRQVALSTQSLWAGLELNQSKWSMKNGKTFERAVRAIQEWKIRAGQNPLSYDFQCERTACVESTLDVVRAMLPYHTQWKHVAGTLPGLAWVWILSTIAQSAPLLEYLEVIPHGGYQTYATVNISLSSVPRLRYLSIPLNNVRLVPGVTNLHGIRTLQFTGGAMSVEDCMSCLAHCPNLEICRMTCADQLRYNGRGVGNVIEATHLTHFHLTAQHDAAACFDRLYAPVLIDLEILITARPYPGTSSRWTHVRSFLERSKSPLQSLVVDNPLMGEDDLIDCLRLVPHLTSLWIRSGSSLTDRGIGFLTLSPYNDICQDLQTLTVSAGERVCSLRSMESLILSRWPGRRANLMNDTEHPSPMWKRELRKICLIGFAFFIYSFELPSIQECIDEGFRLTNYL